MQKILPKIQTKSVLLFTVVFTLVLGVVFRLHTVYAAAGINQQVNFQGKLVTSSGLNVSNGSQTVVFTIYDRASGGTALWTESQSVTTTDGIFSVQLGSVTPIPSTFNFNWDGLYLGIKVGADNEMTPRIRLAAVPYAFNAQKVAGLTVQDTSGNASTSGTLQIANNKTVSFGDAFTTSANALTLTTSGITNVTLPTTGTLATLLGSEIFNNKTIGSAGLVFSGSSTDITTGTNEDLTLVANGTGLINLNDNVTLGGYATISASLAVGYTSVPGGTGNALFSGNVGIGTTSPLQKLSLQDGQIFMGTTGVSQFESGRIRFSEETNSFLGAYLHYDGAANNFNIGVHNTQDQTVGNDTNIIIINRNSGNVGIGTTTLTSSFNVNGGIRAAGAVTGLTGLTLTSGAINLGGSDGTGTLCLLGGSTAAWGSCGTSSQWTTTVNDIYYTTGNVGIGSTAPLGLLNVDGKATGKALAIFNQLAGGDQDLFIASQGGVMKFSISKTGSASMSGGLTLGDGTAANNILRTPYGPLTLQYKSGGNAWSTGIILKDNNGNVGIGTTDTSFGFTTINSTANPGQTVLRLNGNDASYASLQINTTQSSANAQLNYMNQGVLKAITGMSSGDYYISTGVSIAERFRVASTGNVGIGTTVPVGLFNLDGLATGKALAILNQNGGDQAIFTASKSGVTKFVIDTTGNVGIGTTNSSYSLMINPSGGAAATTSFFQDGTASTGKTKVVIKAGAGQIGDSAAYTNGMLELRNSSDTVIFAAGAAGGSNIYVNTIRPIVGNSLAIQGSFGDSSGADFAIGDFNYNTGQDERRNTSGVAQQLTIPTRFSPASGTGIFNAFEVNSTINQNASATGVSRGIYINPTLTLAADYRPFEIAAYTDNTPNTGTSYGALINATTYDYGSSVSMTSANSMTITGAPIGSSNVTIGTAAGLAIQSGSLTGVTNSFGLLVNAQTGATNNYAAAFLNGNVGIGTTAPGSQLQIASNTTTLSQMRLTSSGGTNVSSPTSGDMWWNGTNLYFYNGSTNKDLLAGGGSSQWTTASNDIYYTTGNVGIGTTLPTGRLNLGAATTSLSQIRLNSSAGVNVSSPGTGDLWWNGTNLNFYNGTTTKDLLGDVLTIIKSSDETVTNSTTLQDDDELTFATGANQTWIVDYVVQGSVDAAPDIQLAVTAPSGSTCRVNMADNQSFTNTQDNIGCGVAMIASGNGTSDLYYIKGVITTGGTAGNITLQWTQNSTSPNAVTILTGSYMTAYNMTNANLTAVTQSEWVRNNGVITPKGSSVTDLLLGSSATSSAKIGFINLTSGTPTATLSGNISFNNIAGVSNHQINLNDNGSLNFVRSPGGEGGAAASSAFFISNTGNIGIGVTAPTGLFNVEGAVTGKALSIFNQNGGDQAIFTASKSGVTKFIVDTNGNVGIGTTAPEEKLTANGNILIQSQPTSANSDMQSWTKITGTAGTIGGGTSGVASISASVVYNGSLYIGTNNTNNAEIYRYDGEQLGTWTKVSGTAGTVGGNATTAIDMISSLTVYNGYIYAGTTETDKAEVYRYDGGSSWTQVNVTNTAGKFVTTTAIDGVSSMAVFGGRLFIGTQEGAKAEVYMYNGGTTWKAVNGTAGTFVATNSINMDAVTQMVVVNNQLVIGTKKNGDADVLRWNGIVGGSPFFALNLASTTGSYLINNSAQTGYNEVTSMAVWAGKLVIGLRRGANQADILMYQEPPGGAAPINSWTRLTSALGTIGTANIDNVSAMTVYAGRLYVGTTEANGAEIYRYDDGLSWTRVSQNTAGRIAAGGTSSIDSIATLINYNHRSLFAGTWEGTSAEGYSYAVSIDQSYALKFDAGASQGGGEQNGNDNLGQIFFVASLSANLNNKAGNTGSFVFSHSIVTNNGSYDVAEDYPTRDDTLEPGDVISIDTNERGFVKKSEGDYDYTAIGVYSAKPALRLSQDDDLISGGRAIPVALAGRVPVKVSTENGEIKPGDPLTPSSTSGVAMKAKKSGLIIGQAMEGYDGKGIGKVLVYLKSTSYQGSIAENFTGLNPKDASFGQNILAALAEQGQKTDSEVITDTLIAGLQIVTPRITTHEASIDTISIASGSALSVHIGDNGKVIFGDDEETGIVFDNKGNAQFAGTITAKKIKADSIEGLEIITGQMRTLTNTFASVSALMAQGSSQSVMGVATSSSQIVGNTPNTLQMPLDTLAVTNDAIIDGKLRVKGSGLIEGVLNVIDTFTANDIVINGLATFFDNVVFKKDVIFEGRPTLNNDSAGFAVIKKGDKQVDVIFANEYETTPVINTSIVSEKADNNEEQTKQDEIVLANAANYVITNRTKKGFSILLKNSSDIDLNFSWTAVSIKDSKTFKSDVMPTSSP